MAKKTKPREPMDLIADLDDWENNRLGTQEEIDLFQQLVDNGMAWGLQGMYGRRAMQLINMGEVVNKRPSFAATGNVGKQAR